MHGWRAKIGVIVPSANTVIEPEFYRALPDGTSLHAVRVQNTDASVEDVTAMREDLERSCELLSQANIDIAVFGCTTGSLVDGAGLEQEIESRIAELTGVPAVATAASVTRACEHLDLDSLAALTPYNDELNDIEAEFLEAFGFDVTNIDGLDLKTGIGDVRPETVYRKARGVDNAEADGLFISCTDLRTFEIIDWLERDRGKPVVTSNQATLWDTFRVLDVAFPDTELGSIFE